MYFPWFFRMSFLSVLFQLLEQIVDRTRISPKSIMQQMYIVHESNLLSLIEYLFPELFGSALQSLLSKAAVYEVATSTWTKFVDLLMKQDQVCCSVVLY